MIIALLIISLFFFVLSMIITAISWISCTSALKILREVEAIEASAKERHANSFVQGLMVQPWLDKNGIDN